MAIGKDGAFHYEIEESRDQTGWKTTTIHCHGKLVSPGNGQLKELVKPLLTQGGRIVLDFADLEFMDSSGLGTLVGLKVSALNQGLVKLELVELSPRLKDLLTMTNLTQLFSRQ